MVSNTPPHAVTFPSVAVCSPSSPLYTFRAIGHVRSVWIEKHGCPRQGSLTAHSRAYIQLDAKLAKDFVEGLHEYSHCWLLWVFHQNSASATLKSKVQPPRSDTKTGALACRSPHRPNPIGQSLVRVIGVDVSAGRVSVSGVDLVDGTPIIDIKPYHYSDTVTGPVNMPAWIADTTADSVPRLAVRWTRTAYQQLVQCSHYLVHYTDSELAEVMAAVDESLSNDPRSRHSRASHGVDETSGVPPLYGLQFDALDVSYSVDDRTHTVLVFDVRGYRQSEDGTSARPKLRTREWHHSFQSVYVQQRESGALNELTDEPTASLPSAPSQSAAG